MVVLRRHNASPAAISDVAVTCYSESWRYSKFFSRRERFGRAFPGLGIATVAFAVYCGVEWLFFPEEKHHGELKPLEAHGPSVAHTG